MALKILSKQWDELKQEVPQLFISVKAIHKQSMRLSNNNTDSNPVISVWWFTALWLHYNSEIYLEEVWILSKYDISICDTYTGQK
jgi:hypothetical protein